MPTRKPKPSNSSRDLEATTGSTPKPVGHPVFAQPQPTSDPTTFVVHHPSDGPAYRLIDELNKEHKLFPLPFPAPRGGVEPRLTLEQVFGGNTAAVEKITKSGQIVFHALGDCGNTQGPKTQNLVTDKMVTDFQEQAAKEVPQFALLLGDIVYSFGEARYYYDQFYEPYRNYPAPVLAVAGNHDGMVAPGVHTKSLAAFLRNFCAENFEVMPEAGGLARTAQIQPGVFFTFEVPFVRILALYSNALEDPGVIADEHIGDSQLHFLRAALKRVKDEGFEGALILADHHPPYTASGSRHGWSVDMLAQIDQICEEVGVWPHAFLSGHAHNYQRFTRTRNADGTQIPYIVCGNGGHHAQRLTQKGVAPRAPQILQKAGGGLDQIAFENYDADVDHYGYLRVVVTAKQLRIEYHPAGDAGHVKAPDDSVTVDLKTRKLTHFEASDHGHAAEARRVRSRRA
jgi:hypothetical protein